jgi:hypothetical protein
MNKKKWNSFCLRKQQLSYFDDINKKNSEALALEMSNLQHPSEDVLQGKNSLWPRVNHNRQA